MNHCSCCELGKIGKRRCRGEEDEDRTRDRLSHLPEPVLYNILSFLDTKSAVQTSVLSRGWNRAWKHVLALDLSCLSFRDYRRFQGFVSKVLSLRYDLSLRKVSYMDDDKYRGDGDDEYGWSYPENGRDVNMCVEVIKYALSHDVQHLVINLANRHRDIDEGERFSKLFGTILSSNLKTLELRYVCIDFGLGSCGFRLLTDLRLDHCSLASDRHEDFFSNFPLLENLVLKYCQPWDYNSPGNDMRLKISGHQLLSLEVHVLKSSKMEIYAPRLESFTLITNLGSLESIKLTFSSLVHAVVSIGDWCDFTEKMYLKENRESGAQRFISLFQGLSNATSLVLDSYTIEALDKVSEILEQHPCPFTSLKSLILCVSSSVPKLVNFFLKGSCSMKPKIEYTGPCYY